MIITNFSTSGELSNGSALMVIAKKLKPILVFLRKANSRIEKNRTTKKSVEAKLKATFEQKIYSRALSNWANDHQLDTQNERAQSGKTV